MTKINLAKVIVIVGPTASGKSDLALRLAKLTQGKPFKKKGCNGAEIISADSRQVYRGMDIGTGKVLKNKTFPVPSSKVKSQKSKVLRNKEFYSEGIRHYLIDVASPKKQFTVDDFKKLGKEAVKEILVKNKIPIIVGGTGFYIDVLLGRMSIAEVPPNKKLRVKLGKLSAEQLFKRLQKLDPERAKTIDPKNKRRLIRALEIVITTGKPIPKTYNLKPITYNILWLGINPGKEKLTIKIKKRLDERLKQGMAKEVKNLRKQGVSWKRLDDFGLEYRWISRYLKRLKFSARGGSAFSRKNSQEYQNLLRDIIKYSKRQMTWFKRNKEIHWIKNRKEAEKVTRMFLLSRS
ncbi:MAG: tRNA (adenosine(37)-N6)-dimethylallyltransferase MiaA [Candidatus Yanofskybacteria bacterium]|nr:tRNA (adenosine(37)-N6)-dimethylallyltransferase MiaA [Candidatus Yanofskybacteria bacterium]